ncbi:FkbM family methyltransferase [Lujinxingia litoralis]|uniref:FkbM family methyltransferase n=1 Tax=Lujinxingia litoralis TaxID=2211119 RepID=A0A328C346_9DELT|nr:FkbM family methyltransferase [Lujinxingia litoralis]RAL21181.1 FkbM family methyltransferase [Lujinxingia litoralis]
MKTDVIRQLRRASRFLYQHRGLSRLSDSARRVAANFPLQIDLDDFDGDLHFRLHLDEHMGSQIFWRGSYSEPQTRLLTHLLKPHHTFIDIGANHGEFTLVAAKHLSQGRVFAFEPGDVIFPRLAHNVEANGFDNVTLVNLGLSDSPGSATFYEAETRANDGTYNRGVASLYPDEKRSRPSHTIELTTLDAFVEEHDLERLDLIKIDVEGAELAALQGAHQTLTRFRPHIIFELSQVTCQNAGYPMTRLLDELSAYGYVFLRIDDDRPGFALRALDATRLGLFQNVLAVPPRFLADT